MNRKIPKTPFSTRLSGSAKEIELRLRSIFRWKRKRPPVVLFLLILVLLFGICGGLVAFSSTPRNGPMKQVYPEYFAGNSTDYVEYEDKNDYPYVRLGQSDENFTAAIEYLGGTELRAVLGHKRYIGDFNYRNGAFFMVTESEELLKIELYPDGYIVISTGWGQTEDHKDARVYRAEGFDKEEFLRYWELYTPEEEPPTPETPVPETPTPEFSKEQRLEFINQLVQVQSSYIRSALLDGDVILAPEMKMAQIPGLYRKTLVLTDDQGMLVEGDPFRDQAVIRTYENDNVVIETIAFRYDAVLPDGSTPEDTSVQYIYSVTAKTNQVVSLLSGLHIGDASPFGLEGDYTMEGRPCLKYSYQDGVISGLHAWAIRDMDAYRYANLSDLCLTHDSSYGNVITGSTLPLYEQRTAHLPEPNTTQEVLNFVDAIYQAGEAELWGWLFPGTGPIAVSMDELYDEVYALFAQRKWTRWEGAIPEPLQENWGIYLTCVGSTCISANLNGSYINVMESSPAGSWNAWYYAEDDDGGLVQALTDLWDGPELRYAMYYQPELIETEQKRVAEYIMWFNDFYLNSGAIEEIQWHETTLLDVEDSGYSHILMRYSVKPTDPANPAWQYHIVSEDGWVELSVVIVLGQHEVSWYEYPRD